MLLRDKMISGAGLSILPDDELYREVTAIGPICPVKDGIAEVQCQIVLADRTTLSATRPGQYTGSYSTLSVGVGTLPLVKPGSIFKGQELIADVPKEWRTETKAVRNLGKPRTIGRICEIQARAAQRDKPARFVTPYLPLGAVGEASFAYSVALSDEAEGYGRHRALVPVAEIIRFLWGCTTGISKRTFDGKLGRPELTDDAIFNRKTSEWLSESEGIFRLDAMRRLSEMEIRSCLRLCINQTAHRSWGSIFKAIQINGAADAPIYPKIEFPLSGNLVWTYHYRWIGIESNDAPGDPKPRKLITRIIDIAEPSEVRHVIVSLPAIAVLDETAPQITSFLTSVQRVTARTPRMGSRVEPSNKFLPSEVLEPSAPSLPFTVEEIARPKKYGDRPILKYRIVDEETVLGSTADAGSSDDDIAPVVIIDKVPIVEVQPREPDNRPTPDRLKALLQAIEVLKISYDCKVEIVPELVGSEDVCWHYPFRTDAGYINWSVLNPITNERRRVVIAKVVKGGKTFHLFESEMRHSDDFFALGVMQSRPSEHLDRTQIANILESLARRRGVWKDLSRIYLVETQTHRSEWTPEKFAGHIIKRLDNFGEQKAQATNNAENTHGVEHDG